MADTTEFNDIWINDGDGSVIFTTSPTQSDHPVHKYRSVQDAISDLERVVGGLRSRLPLEDQPPNYGTLLAESIDREMQEQHFLRGYSIRLKRECVLQNSVAFRECDEEGNRLKKGTGVMSLVRFKKTFLEFIGQVYHQDTEYLSLTIKVETPKNSNNTDDQSKDKEGIEAG